MIPIRCFTCGKVIANKWEKYKSHLNSGLSNSDALKNIGMSRYCCRRMFLTHVDVDDKLLLFPNSNDGSSGKKSNEK